MRNPLFFLSRYDTINNAIRKRIESIISTFAFFIGFVAVFVATFFWTAMMARYIAYIFPWGIPWGNFSLLILLIINIALWWIWTAYIVYLVGQWLIYPFSYAINRISQHITDLHHAIGVSISSVQNIDEILGKIDSIKHLYSFLSIYKWAIYYISRSHYPEFSGILEQTLEWILSILLDLRSDLIVRLAEQQSTLEQAKSEVSEHIHWTTELNQISNLQRVRLDRQIEQFEELQRVLVMV
jgi:hypothetical protein